MIQQRDHIRLHKVIRKSTIRRPPTLRTTIHRNHIAVFSDSSDLVAPPEAGRESAMEEDDGRFLVRVFVFVLGRESGVPETDSSGMKSVGFERFRKDWCSR